MNPYNYGNHEIGHTAMYEEYGHPETMVSYHQSSSWLWHLISVIVIIIAFVIFYYLTRPSTDKKWKITTFTGGGAAPPNWVGEANNAWVNKSTGTAEITLNVVPPVNPTGKLFLIDNTAGVSGTAGAAGANIKVVGASGATAVGKNVIIEAGKSAFSIWINSTDFNILKADSNISTT